MREIKFRIWNDYDKKMINWDEMCEQNLPNIFRLASYNKYLMQFTGLKDKNGKEIYEGDIVEIDKDVAKGFDICNKGIINYSNGGFMVTQNDGTYQKILSSLLVLGDLNNIFRGNVIGNIYDNPELLKED